MDRRLRIIQLLIMIAMSFVLFLFVAYARFVTLEKTEPIIVNTGSLRAECKFYRGIDADFDGDLDEDDFVEIREANLQFTNVIPGQIYTFKLSVKNTGTVSGFLSVTIDNITSDEQGLLDYFIVSFSSPEEKEIALSGADQNGDLNLFSDYVLAADATFDFIFQIRIDGNLNGSQYHLKSLTIAHFIVDLIQEHYVE